MKYKLVIDHPRDGRREETFDSFSEAMKIGHERLHGFYDHSTVDEPQGRFYTGDRKIVGIVSPI